MCVGIHVCSMDDYGHMCIVDMCIDMCVHICIDIHMSTPVSVPVSAWPTACLHKCLHMSTRVSIIHTCESMPHCRSISWIVRPDGAELKSMMDFLAEPPRCLHFASFFS